MSGLEELSIGEFAVRLTALRGTASYVAYLAPRDRIDAVLDELEDETRSLVPDGVVHCLRAADADELVAALESTDAEFVCADVRVFASADWATVDRRRSAIAHRGVLIFVTTPESFEALMRVAPNLSSWLGGEVFGVLDEHARRVAVREQRLSALRSWSGKTD